MFFWELIEEPACEGLHRDPRGKAGNRSGEENWGGRRKGMFGLDHHHPPHLLHNSVSASDSQQTNVK